MRRAVLPFVLLMGLLATGLVAGCGGSNDNGTTATAALTKGQLVQRANAICAQATQTDHQAQESLGQSPTVAQVRQYLIGAMARIQEEIHQIRAIGVPQGDEGQVNAFLDEAQQALDSVEAHPGQLDDRSADPFARANQLANAYGLTVCAKQ